LDTPDEALVVRRCKDGDREAFRVLAERYEGTLFGIAYLMTHDRPTAEDSVQEAFLKMWKHLPSLRSEDKLRAWLVRILINEVRNAERKARAPTVPLEAASEQAISDSFERTIESAEVRQRLREAIRTLPRDQKEAVVLRYFGGLSTSDAAAAMGCREGTVKSRVSRGIDRLQAVLRSFGNEGADI